MSATTEHLAEKIRLTEERIADPTIDPQIRSIMEQELQKLRRALMSATDALTEGKQLLKS